MNKKILTLTLLIASAPGLALAASVYKWTDENGVTHFGDRQPTGKQSEKLNVRSGAASQPGSERKSPQEQLKELQQRQDDQAVSQRSRAVQEAQAKQREANCATARANLDAIDSNARIRVEENGEQRYLSPEEIAEQRAKARQIAQENCGSQSAQTMQ